jgi:DNA-directed RNA polymerase specialized sigma24 family protein
MEIAAPPGGSGGEDPIFRAGQKPVRQALAEFVLKNQERVRAVARRKLSPRTRAACDSEDVLSSVLRRLDDMARRGVFQPRSEPELWALIKSIARNTALSRTRLIEGMRNRLTEDGPYAYEVLKRLNACETDDEATLLVYRMMMSLKDATDRQIMGLLFRGARHKAIATLLGISEEASRQRWLVIRRDLSGRFESGVFDG